MSARICPDCEKSTDLETCPGCGTPTLDNAIFRPRVDPLIGKLVNGRYLVQEVLGQGGMGKVYVAEQIAMKRQVALKVIRVQDSGEMSEKMSVYKRFQQEALASSRLEHHNTVRVFDFGITEDGTLFIAMELLHGLTLTKVMQAGPIVPSRAIRIAIQLCRSLAEAHGKGIVHRDLKPDNIMVFDTPGESDYVKLLDFGIAKITAITGESEITRTGLIMGTPAYMAPEQATAGLIGPGTDLYSLGIILYEALTGHAPFTGGTPLAVLLKHVSEEVPPIVVDGFPPDVPQGLIDIVLRLLEKKASARPASAMDVARLLESVIFAVPVVGGAVKSVPTDPLVKIEHMGHVDPALAVPAVNTGRPEQSEHVAKTDPLEKIGVSTQVDPFESTGSLTLKLRQSRRWLALVGVLFLAVLMVVAALWIGAGDTEPVSQTAPAVKPTSAAVVPVVSPDIPKTVDSQPTPDVVTNVDISQKRDLSGTAESPKIIEVPPPPPPSPPPSVSPPVQVKRDVAKAKPKIKVQHPPKQPSLPRCVRSKCPFTGDCVDAEGNRINGGSFCGDLAF